MRPGGSRTSERSFLFISKRQATGVAGSPIALLAAAAAGTGDDLLCPGGKDGGGVRWGGRGGGCLCKGHRLFCGLLCPLQLGHPLAQGGDFLIPPGEVGCFLILVR